jgi:23S rRNA (cytosine1962-C5)-methyltransferase
MNPDSTTSVICNRIEKNFKKIYPWAKRNQFEAWRLYDRDIPDFPFIVDIYKNSAVIYNKGDEKIDSDPKKAHHFDELVSAIKKLPGFEISEFVHKDRARQKGEAQYEKLAEKNQFFSINEGKAKFLVNIHDYLDTGLFLDHRPMRYRIFKLSKNKTVLNLFCYTGSVSVWAALGGAKTTSVDMSATYIDWAQQNFKHNSIDLGPHEFIKQNALEYLEFQSGRSKFDIIFLDPPTFSNSKRMDDFFEVEKDQEFLVNSAMSMLNPGGILFFSNNKRKFKISPTLTAKFNIADISKDTIPLDFHDPKIHQCYEIRERN